MYLSNKTQELIQTGKLPEIEKALAKEGADYNPYYIDRGDAGLDLLRIVNFDTETGQPEVDIDRAEAVFSTDFERDELTQMLEQLLGENPNIKDAEDTAQDLCSTFWHKTQGPTQEIIDGLKHDSNKLLVLIPVYTNKGEYDFYGDTKELVWHNFRNQAHRLGKAPREMIDQDLAEVLDNSQSGMCGIIAKLDAVEVAKWVGGTTLQRILRAKDPQEAAWIGVYDLCNGSGHFVDFHLEWKKIKLPRNAQCVLVNNFINDTFGVVGVSKIDFGKGTKWCNNLWFTPCPKKPTTPNTETP